MTELYEFKPSWRRKDATTKPQAMKPKTARKRQHQTFEDIEWLLGPATKDSTRIEEKAEEMIDTYSHIYKFTNGINNKGMTKSTYMKLLKFSQKLDIPQGPRHSLLPRTLTKLQAVKKGYSLLSLLRQEYKKQKINTLLHAKKKVQSRAEKKESCYEFQYTPYPYPTTSPKFGWKKLIPYRIKTKLKIPRFKKKSHNKPSFFFNYWKKRQKNNLRRGVNTKRQTTAQKLSQQLLAKGSWNILSGTGNWLKPTTDKRVENAQVGLPDRKKKMPPRRPNQGHRKPSIKTKLSNTVLQKKQNLKTKIEKRDYPKINKIRLQLNLGLDPIYKQRLRIRPIRRRIEYTWLQQKDACRRILTNRSEKKPLWYRLVYENLNTRPPVSKNKKWGPRELSYRRDITNSIRTQLRFQQNTLVKALIQQVRTDYNLKGTERWDPRSRLSRKSFERGQNIRTFPTSHKQTPLTPKQLAPFFILLTTSSGTHYPNPIPTSRFIKVYELYRLVFTSSKDAIDNEPDSNTTYSVTETCIKTIRLANLKKKYPKYWQQYIAKTNICNNLTPNYLLAHWTAQTFQVNHKKPRPLKVAQSGRTAKAIAGLRSQTKYHKQKTQLQLQNALWALSHTNPPLYSSKKYTKYTNRVLKYYKQNQKKEPKKYNFLYHLQPRTPTSTQTVLKYSQTYTNANPSAKKIYNSDPYRRWVARKNWDTQLVAPNLAPRKLTTSRPDPQLLIADQDTLFVCNYNAKQWERTTTYTTDTIPAKQLTPVTPAETKYLELMYAVKELRDPKLESTLQLGEVQWIADKPTAPKLLKSTDFKTVVRYLTTPYSIPTSEKNFKQSRYQVISSVPALKWADFQDMTREERAERLKRDTKGTNPENQTPSTETDPHTQLDESDFHAELNSEETPPPFETFLKRKKQNLRVWRKLSTILAEPTNDESTESEYSTWGVKANSSITNENTYLARQESLRQTQQLGASTKVSLTEHALETETSTYSPNGFADTDPNTTSLNDTNRTTITDLKAQYLKEVLGCEPGLQTTITLRKKSLEARTNSYIIVESAKHAARRILTQTARRTTTIYADKLNNLIKKKIKVITKKQKDLAAQPLPPELAAIMPPTKRAQLEHIRAVILGHNKNNKNNPKATSKKRKQNKTIRKRRYKFIKCLKIIKRRQKKIAQQRNLQENWKSFTKNTSFATGYYMTRQKSFFKKRKIKVPKLHLKVLTPGQEYIKTYFYLKQIYFRSKKRKSFKRLDRSIGRFLKREVLNPRRGKLLKKKKQKYADLTDSTIKDTLLKHLNS